MIQGNHPQIRNESWCYHNPKGFDRFIWSFSSFFLKFLIWILVAYDMHKHDHQKISLNE